MKQKRWMALMIVAVILVGSGIWFGWGKFEGIKPLLQIIPDKNFLGPELTLKVEDVQSGLASVKVEVIQKGKVVSLLDEKPAKGTFRVEKKISLRPLPQGLRDGDAQIRIAVRDRSWIRGNLAVLEKSIVIDSKPPQISVLGGIHYLNQGGAGLIPYQTSEETPTSGVKWENNYFSGFSIGRNHYIAYVAWPCDQSGDGAAAVVAEDRAGNGAQSSLSLKLRPRKFRKDRIQISDGFLSRVLPYFTALDPSLKGTPVEIFLRLNRDERKLDHQKIQEICRLSGMQPLWSGVFLRLPNSKPTAFFGQERAYIYEGKMIDQQVHLGVDLASVNQAPIPAANSGRVIFAGPLGIYGNTVVVDHGCGLFSMYSHLSRIETELKKEVKKGEILGRTGYTGMAGGDHLHFSMLVHGVFVNPVEWWDPHWIRDNIDRKMKALRNP
jgi:murein DD-endopeptidase MepM/ murein hydrolase activator NlpD